MAAVPNAPHEIDASGIFNDRRAATRTGTARGEKAIWDNSQMQEIRLRKGKS